MSKNAKEERAKPVVQVGQGVINHLPGNGAIDLAAQFLRKRLATTCWNEVERYPGAPLVRVAQVRDVQRVMCSCFGVNRKAMRLLRTLSVTITCEVGPPLARPSRFISAKESWLVFVKKRHAIRCRSRVEEVL